MMRSPRRFARMCKTLVDSNRSGILDAYKLANNSMDIASIVIDPANHKLTITDSAGAAKDFLDSATITGVTDEKVTVTKSDGSTEEFDKPAA